MAAPTGTAKGSGGHRVPPEGKGKEGKNRGGRVGTPGVPRDLVPARGTKFLREIRPPSAEAVVNPEDRAMHTREKLERCRAWHVPAWALCWVGSVPKLRWLGLQAELLRGVTAGDAIFVCPAPI